MNLEFCETRGISRLAEDIVASQGIYSVICLCAAKLAHIFEPFHRLAYVENKQCFVVWLGCLHQAKIPME